ncbi:MULTISPECIES: lysylphosphatidylglycerol synthase domain-containing protein [Alphaproteobacteria]|uniref:Membrane protein n=2 Tax=Alphaproteobacteria TaxID=28211 RepID=A0A512HG70_9HYPH|nr:MULTISPECIES: lysylphosphatidylglycerol synthase domain-containing protein [Alphaproteobacteria]GEO84452.1 membrane protein [Ciceribacter naphthalenivorans]GLR22415.1 membrane protein [Ciceribacter naphthalenivorans]GLT05271.1 membrane protein [Sphingomonas psychrolutea]
MTPKGDIGKQSWLRRHRALLISLVSVGGYAFFVEEVWGWASIVERWSSVGFGHITLAFLLLLFTYVARAWRLHDYFPRETSGRFVELFHLAQVHNLLNIMLPFRSGETSFPLLMRSEFSVPLLRGTSALLVMRVLDLHALLAAGGLGLVLEAADKRLPAALWIAFLIAPVPAYLLKGPVLARVRPKLKGKLGRILDGINEGLPVNAASLVRAWFATAVNWGVKVVVFAWVLGLMGVSPLAATFGGALGGELSSVLPFHAPGGVGTYPAAIAAGALALGASSAKEGIDLLGRAAVNLHLIIILSALIGTGVSILLDTLRKLAAGR